MDTPSREEINKYGQAYFGTVAVLTNALCVGACEVFVSLMKDLQIARIYGEDASTAGVGAITIDSSLLSTYFPGDFIRSDKAGAQKFRYAWKQMLRTGVNEGIPLDENGVSVDEVILVSYNSYNTQPHYYHMKRGLLMYPVHRINYKMRFESQVYLSIDGSHYFDISVNQTLVMRGGSRGVSKVCISENETVLKTVSVSRLPFHRWKASFKLPESSSNSRILIITGLSNSGSVVTQTERRIRIIPAKRLVLKKWRYFWNWHYEYRWIWDFTFGKFVNLYTISGLEKDGWNLSSENKLFIPESCNTLFMLII